MRIDPNQLFELNSKNHRIVDQGPYSVTLEHAQTKKTEEVTGHAAVIKESTYEKPGKEVKKEVQEEAAAASDLAAARQQEMAVLSNTMSEEDFREYRENGGSVMGTESGELLTVVDKIKITLAEAGVDVGKISASDEAIKSVSGGRITADQAAAVLAAADLPATNENISDTKKAFELASSLEKFGDGAVKYMVDNGKSGTIENLYYAASGAGNSFGTLTLPEDAKEQMLPQMEQIIEEVGLLPETEIIENSSWMVANDIPLNEENLKRVTELRGMELPFPKEKVLSAITDALTEGKRPQQAILPENERELSRLSARRMLSETQLIMTEEANRSLAGKKMEIDTADLRETVETLKQEEKDYYQSLLTRAGAEPSELNVQKLRDTEDAIDEIKMLPAYTLGVKEADTETLSGIREAGRALKQKLDSGSVEEKTERGRRYAAAYEVLSRYESMRTEVRKDLGDSIRKAFRNTDAILRDLGLPETEQNRRAVRILGYNSTEITEESVAVIKAKDEEVQRAFKALTPGVVAKMIKENLNPLDMKLPELNEAARVLSEGEGISDEERFSEYLYKLEHNRLISENERASYIGIYRLMDQVQRSDGAAIGALVNQGADITMRTLLSAVRSAKKGEMDYRIDDDFAGVSGRSLKTDIIRQIDSAFDDTVYQTDLIRDITEEISPEAFRTLMKNDADWQERTPEEFLNQLRNADTEQETLEFTHARMEEFADAAEAEEQIYRMMERYELPNTAENLIALQQMARYPNAAVRRIFGRPVDDYRDENGEADFEAVKEGLLEAFGEAVSEPEELAEAQKKLAETAENVMRSMLSSQDTDTTELDVRTLKLAVNRFRIAEKMASEENYHIPVLIAGETGEMNLKIVSGTEKKGLVDIMFSLSSLGSVAAKLRLEDGKLTGFLASDRQETVDLFSNRGQEFLQAFTSVPGVSSVSLNPVSEEKLDLIHFNDSTEEENAVAREERKNAGSPRTKTLYQIAKSFLSVLKSF